MKSEKKLKIQVYAAIAWLVLTCSLILWWMYFALGLVMDSPHSKPEHRFMLITEGVTLLTFLIAGGATLIYFILQEQKRSQTLTQFFSAFSHDIKTSLSSLKLQVESLREDATVASSQDLKKTMTRLLGDTSRLQLQVENSLYLGAQKTPQLHIEKIDSKNLFHFLQDAWPQLEFEQSGQGVFLSDRRALESVFNNLSHNSWIHGRATKVQISIQPVDSENLKLVFKDNGIGFKGDWSQLGHMHFRQNPSSGSGLGLFIVKSLTQQMGGEVLFQPSDSGFEVQLCLKGLAL